MNWFRRHLNWTGALATIICFGITTTNASTWSGIDSLPDLFILFLVSNTPFWFFIVAAAERFFSISGMILLFGLYGATILWLLSNKCRRRTWLLLTVFVPFGWIAPLCLKNKSLAVQPSGNLD